MMPFCLPAASFRPVAGGIFPLLKGNRSFPSCPQSGKQQLHRASVRMDFAFPSEQDHPGGEPSLPPDSGASDVNECARNTAGHVAQALKASLDASSYTSPYWTGI